MKTPLLIAALALSCGRELAVPPESKRPELTSFQPDRAFANAVLTIQGKNFDPIASNNIVQFAAETVRAFQYDAAGGLQVRVPASTFAALSGTISVQTPTGSSNPSDQPFTYIGRGHPFFGTLVGDTLFRHRPPGVALLGGHVVLASRAADALVSSSSDDAALPLPAQPGALVSGPYNQQVFVGAGSKILAVHAHQATPLTADLGALTAGPLAWDGVSSRLFAVATDPLGVAHLLAFDAATLAPLGDRVLDGAPVGLAALADGRAAVLTPAAALLIDPATAAPADTVPAIEGQSLAGPAVLTTLTATPSLIAVFTDGTMRQLPIASPYAWSAAAMGTGSAETPAAIVETSSGLVVSKPLEGVVRTLSPQGATVAEHFFSGRPRALYGTAGLAYVWVADDAGNTVDSYDHAQGSLASRYTFPLGIGSAIGCGQGSAVEIDDRLNHFRFLAVATRINHLVAIDYNSLTIQRPVQLATGVSPPRGIVTSPGNIGVWVVHDVEVGRLADDDSETILTADRPGTQCVLFPDQTGEAVVLLRPAGVSVLRGAALSAEVALPGPAISGGVRGDGKIVVFYGDPARPSASPRARLYTLAALESGGAPEASFDGVPRYQGFDGAFLTGWGPLLFFTWDDELKQPAAVAIPLDDALAPQAAVASDMPERGPLGLTPDAYFIVWQRQSALDDMLRVSNAYDLNGIWSGFAAYQLLGAPVAPAFDSSGEWMYVPVPDQDMVQTFQ